MNNKLEITHQWPVNVQDDWKHLFKPDSEYLKVDLKVKTLTNVFVNHYGLVLKNGFLVKGCAPNIGFSGYDECKYFVHWKKAMEQNIVSKYGKSIQSETWVDATYLLIHSPWFSYYFWITECMPRLLKVKDQLDEVTLIYPEIWDNFTFVKESLSLFPNLKIRKLKSDVHLRVKNLILPEVKPWTPMFIPELVEEVRDFFFSKLDELGIQSPIDTDKVYISRSAAKRRKFDDETKVEMLLGKYGFVPVRMEELSFFGQIALMRKTKLMTAITGAGLINILFMERGGKFLDLTNEEYKRKSQYKFHFFKLCNILDVKYAVSFLDTANDPEIDHWSNQDMLADIDLIEQDLQLLMNI